MRRNILVAVVLATWGASCSQGTSSGASLDQVATSSTQAPATTEPDPRAVVSSDRVICGSPDLTSPSIFEETEGTYLAYVLSFVNGRPQYDVVQWLSGQEAVEAYAVTNPEDVGGPPGGFVIVNDNAHRRTSPLADDAPIALLDAGTSDLARRSVADFENYVTDDATKRPPLVWITLQSGIVVSACEHHVPAN